VAIVAVVWGSIGVLVRWVDLPAAAVVFGRVAIAALALGAWLALHHDTVPGAPVFRHRPVRTVATGALLAGHWVALFAAYQRAPIGTVLLITYLAPVGIALTAPRALGETVGRRTIAALVLAVAGTALIVGPGADGASASGIVLAGVAAVSFVALVLSSKPLSEAYGGMRLAFCELAVAAVVLVPFATVADWGDPTVSWWWLVVLGVGHTAIGVGVYLGALARMPATDVGILGYLEPASAVVFAWVFLSEEPGLGTLAGGLLIVAAGVLVIRNGRRAPVGEEVASVPG
jgi:drug/metabolite transporter (DMT)-like permease